MLAATRMGQALELHRGGGELPLPGAPQRGRLDLFVALGEVGRVDFDRARRAVHIQDRPGPQVLQLPPGAQHHGHAEIAAHQHGMGRRRAPGQGDGDRAAFDGPRDLARPELVGHQDGPLQRAARRNPVDHLAELVQDRRARFTHVRRPGGHELVGTGGELLREGRHRVPPGRLGGEPAGQAALGGRPQLRVGHEHGVRSAHRVAGGQSPGRRLQRGVQTAALAVRAGTGAVRDVRDRHADRRADRTAGRAARRRLCRCRCCSGAREPGRRGIGRLGAPGSGGARILLAESGLNQPLDAVQCGARVRSGRRQLGGFAAAERQANDAQQAAQIRGRYPAAPDPHLGVEAGQLPDQLSDGTGVQAQLVAQSHRAGQYRRRGLGGSSGPSPRSPGSRSPSRPGGTALRSLSSGSRGTLRPSSASLLSPSWPGCPGLGRPGAGRRPRGGGHGGPASAALGLHRGRDRPLDQRRVHDVDPLGELRVQELDGGLAGQPRAAQVIQDDDSRGRIRTLERITDGRKGRPQAAVASADPDDRDVRCHLSSQLGHAGGQLR